MAPQPRARAPPWSGRAQHLAVIDAVPTERHRGQQRHDLAPSIRCARPLSKIDRPIDQRLDPEPISKHRWEQHPGVRDRPLVIEDHPRRVRQTPHHMGDLLSQARRRPARQLSACSGGHLKPRPGRLPTKTGGSRLRSSSATVIVSVSRELRRIALAAATSPTRRRRLSTARASRTYWRARGQVRAAAGTRLGAWCS
jgi:hypothetical protein